MGEYSEKKKRSKKKSEEPLDPMPDALGVSEPEPAEPATPEWDEQARTVEAALVPPPPGGGPTGRDCGCGDALRVEMLDSQGQPTGVIRVFGYKTATAQVGAKRARYVD